MVSGVVSFDLDRVRYFSCVAARKKKEGGVMWRCYGLVVDGCEVIEGGGSGLRLTLRM